MTVKFVQAVAPHSAVGLEPAVEFDKRLRTQLIEAPLPVRAHRNKAGVSQHAQMLGYRGLRQIQPLDKCTYWQLAVQQLVQDPPAARLGNDFNRGACDHAP
jgi:hypothetical protein